MAPSESYWFRRNPRLALLGVGGLLSFATAVSVELVARAFDLPPAFVTPLPPVRELEIDQLFITDADGIFRPDPERFPGLNPAGFRGPDFRARYAGRTRVMFLGDSFVWGAAAAPMNECFVDRIGRAGYLAFNLGVPGVGPNQYEALAERYIPVIEPHVVVACLFVNNDINIAAPMIPHHPVHHITNAGWLWAYDCWGPEAKPLSARQAYERAYGVGLGYWASYLRYYASQSLVASALWSRLIGPPPNRWEGCEQGPYYYPKAELDGIRRAASAGGASLIVALIPGAPGILNPGPSPRETLAALAEFNPVMPEGLGSEHYAELPDGHFNNAGHELYAAFLLERLAAAGFGP